MLTRLQIINFRNIAMQQIDGLSVVNLFLGENGAGKTSVLEAIHTLGHGRSFRKQGGQKDALVSFGSDRLVVFGERDPTVVRGVDEGRPGVAERFGLSRATNGEIQIKHNGEKLYRLSDIALRLPMIALNADTFELLTGAASERRRYLDWAVFHVEHEFREASKRYLVALQQRNAFLRQMARTQNLKGRAQEESYPLSEEQKHQLSVWTDPLVEAGEQVATLRARQFKVLNQLFCQVLGELGGSGLGVKLIYRSGWSRGSCLSDALNHNLASDLARGFTQFGPHRADVQVLVDNESSGQPRLARDVLSRGQLKLIVLSMKLAQILFYLETTGGAVYDKTNDDRGDRVDFGLQRAESREPLVLLLDDVAAEFDGLRLALLGKTLGGLLCRGGLQVFATATTKELLERFLEGLSQSSLKVFHVEQGVLGASE